MNIRTAKHRFGRRIIRPALVAASVIVVAVCAAAPVLAAGTPSPAAVLAQRAVTGQTNCAALTSTQFVVIGQTFITRMLGPGAAQGAITAHMQALSSASGLAQAYGFMGRRLAGCATGNGPRSFGEMMGMIGGGTGTSSGMMGEGNGPTHSGTTSSMTVVVIGVGLVALVAVATGSMLMVTRRRRTLLPSHHG